MDMNVEYEKKVPILQISGEIDHFVAPKLQRQIDDLIDADAVKLIFDFTKVDYLDSGGIGVLFNAMQQLLPREGTMGIVCVEPNLIRILELVGLFNKKTNVFLFKDREEALAAMEKKIEVG